MKTMIGSAVTAAIMLAALPTAIPAAQALISATGVHGESAPLIREARRGRGADDPAGHVRGGKGADDPVGHG